MCTFLPARGISAIHRSTIKEYHNEMWYEQIALTVPCTILDFSNFKYKWKIMKLKLAEKNQ